MKKKIVQFGKKTDNIYKIIERKFKDNNVYFFVEITNIMDLQLFDIEIPDTYIFEESFKTYDEALNCVNKLKKEDEKITVSEEKIHYIKNITNLNKTYMKDLENVIIDTITKKIPKNEKGEIINKNLYNNLITAVNETFIKENKCRTFLAEGTTTSATKCQFCGKEEWEH